MCPRAPQTSPIDRKWKVELIYDGFMLRWPDRLAIGAENECFAHGCSIGVQGALFGIAQRLKKKEIPFTVATKVDFFYWKIFPERPELHEAT